MNRNRNAKIRRIKIEALDCEAVLIAFYLLEALCPPNLKLMIDRSYSPGS